MDGFLRVRSHSTDRFRSFDDFRSVAVSFASKVVFLSFFIPFFKFPVFLLLPNTLYFFSCFQIVYLEALFLEKGFTEDQLDTIEANFPATYKLTYFLLTSTNSLGASLRC